MNCNTIILCKRCADEGVRFSFKIRVESFKAICQNGVVFPDRLKCESSVSFHKIGSPEWLGSREQPVLSSLRAGLYQDTFVLAVFDLDSNLLKM